MPFPLPGTPLYDFWQWRNAMLEKQATPSIGQQQAVSAVPPGPPVQLTPFPEIPGSIKINNPNAPMQLDLGKLIGGFGPVVPPQPFIRPSIFPQPPPPAPQEISRGTPVLSREQTGYEGLEEPYTEGVTQGGEEDGVKAWEKVIDAVLADKDLQLTLMKVGMQMMQPIQPGQTPLGHIAQSASGGIDYLTGLKTLRHRQGVEERKAATSERQAAAQERYAGVAEERNKIMREQYAEGAQERAAKAKLNEAMAGYYERMPDTSKGGAATGAKMPKSFQEYIQATLGKVKLDEMSIHDAASLRDALTNVIETGRVAFDESGKPRMTPAEMEAALAGGTTGTKGTKEKPLIPEELYNVQFPPTWQEAVRQIRAAYKEAIPPKMIPVIEQKLKEKYPNYIPGAIHIGGP